MSRVGERVLEARTKSGMSLKQFAKKLGVAEAYILDVEAGRKIVNENFIKKIEGMLNININEDSFESAEVPVENIKEDSPSARVNEQWENAFSHILKKIPVFDINMKEIHDYKYLPIMDRKIEGYSADKIIYVRVPDDSMRGFRIQKDDRVMVFQNPEMLNNTIALVEIDGKRCIRQLKRLDNTKVLILSHSNDLKTETRDVKSFSVLGRCVKLEVDI